MSAPLTQAYWDIAARLVAALLVGALVGMERSYHGRPAGFRTHALVCVSTALLMLVTVYQDLWFHAPAVGRVTLDPTRMSQGIMTGIGFLGAGAIIKAGTSIRGLTTAASIWITAAIGILVGIGFYLPAALATVITLGVLSLFRWIEAKVPSMFHAEFVVRFARDAALPEAEMRGLVVTHGFTIANLCYRLNSIDGFLEYRMIIRSARSSNACRLSESLMNLPTVTEFRIVPTGD